MTLGGVNARFIAVDAYSRPYQSRRRKKCAQCAKRPACNIQISRKSSHRTPAVGLTGNVDTDVSFLGMQCISVQPFRKKKKKMLRVKPQLALECFGRSLESV